MLADIAVFTLALTLLAGPLVASASPRHARVAAIASVGLALLSTMLCTLAGTMGASTNVSDSPSWFVLRLDALAAPELMLMLVLALSVLVSAPRRRFDAVSDSAVAWMTFSLAMCALSSVAWWLGLWQLAALVPACARLRRHSSIRLRAFAVFGLGSAIGLAVLLILHDARPWASERGFALLSSELLTRAEMWLLWAFLLVRMGVFPAHSWLLRLTARGPLDAAVMMTQSGVGLLLFVRLMPVALHLGPLPLQVVIAVGLTGAWFASLMAVGQRDVRRGVASVGMSVHHLLLVALASADAQSVSGAMMYSTAVGLGVGGLLLVSVWTQARFGETGLAQLGGLGQRAPHLAMAYLTFAAVTFGLPGTVTFIAEDLIVHGLVEHRPVLAACMMGCTVLNAIALVRLFTRVYLGASVFGAEPVRGVDLLRRERWVAAALLAIVVSLGVFPQPLLALTARVARDVLQIERAPRPNEHPSKEESP